MSHKIHQLYEEDLFKGKGKEYGAYVIRKRKNEFAAKGLLIGVLFVVLLYLSPFIWVVIKNRNEAQTHKVEQRQVITYSELMAPPPIETVMPPQQKLEEAPKISSIKYTKPVIKPDDEVIEEEYRPTQEDLNQVNPGIANVEGIDSIVVTQTEVATPSEKEEVYVSFEKAPEFVGGAAAMNDYLRENIRYPQAAREMRIQGMVIVQFVVGRNGSISDAEVVRGIGGGCDEEALRVVKAMPKWQPGIQNKREVSVRYAIPIRFILQE